MSSKTTNLRNALFDARGKLMMHNTWKHYKGGVYKVDDVVIDTVTGQPAVLYHRVDGPDFNFLDEHEIKFCRPFSEWFDIIEPGVPRFKPTRKVEVWQDVT